MWDEGRGGGFSGGADRGVRSEGESSPSVLGLRGGGASGKTNLEFRLITDCRGIDTSLGVTHRRGTSGFFRFTPSVPVLAASTAGGLLSTAFSALDLASSEMNIIEKTSQKLINLILGVSTGTKYNT